MNEKPAAVILDFDKTLAYLYRDQSLLTELAARICRHYRAAFPVEEELERIDGYFAWYELHRRALSRFGEAGASSVNAEGEKIVARFEKEVMEKVPFMDGVVDTLKALKHRGVSLSIVSTNSGDAIREALEREGVAELFDAVLGRSLPFDPQKVKPSPYLIERCVRKLRLSKKTTWYAGDDVCDMEAAKRAGVTPVGIATGRHSREELIGAGAVLCLDRLSDLPGALDP